MVLPRCGRCSGFQVHENDEHGDYMLCLNCGCLISLDNKKLLKKRQRMQGQEIQRRSERMLNELREKTLFRLGDKL